MIPLANTSIIFSEWILLHDNSWFIELLASSADPDQPASMEQSDLGLHCFHGKNEFRTNIRENMVKL